MIGFCADVHIGNHKKLGGRTLAGCNERCEIVVETLARACDRLLAFGVRPAQLVVCGDLFDTSRPSPQVLRKAQATLERLRDSRTGESGAVLLVGNHDRVSDAPGDHALGPLAPVARIIERPTVMRPGTGHVELLCVPYMPGNAREWFAPTVASLANECERGVGKPRERVLCFHLGIEDDRTSHYLKGAHDAIDLADLRAVMAEHGIRHAFAGNWHEFRSWDANETGKIVQCSALAPTGFDNAGLDGFGMLHLYDHGAKQQITSVEIPGPRFLTVQGASAAETVIDSANEAGHLVFARYRADAAHVKEAQATLDEWISEAIVHAGFVDPEDDEQAEKAARDAAKAARKAETLGQALAEFVEHMPLEEGIDRAEVVQRASEYLGGA